MMTDFLRVAFAFCCMVLSELVEDRYVDPWFEVAGKALRDVSVSLGYGDPEGAAHE